MNDFFIFEWFYAAITAAVSTEILLHGQYRGEINNVKGVGQIDYQSEYTRRATVPAGGRPLQFYSFLADFSQVPLRKFRV